MEYDAIEVGTPVKFLVDVDDRGIKARDRSVVPVDGERVLPAAAEDDAEADWIYGHIKNKHKNYGFIESPSPQLSGNNGNVAERRTARIRHT